MRGDEARWDGEQSRGQWISIDFGSFFAIFRKFFDILTHLKLSCIFVTIFCDLSSIFGGFGSVFGRIFGGF